MTKFKTPVFGVIALCVMIFAAGCGQKPAAEDTTETPAAETSAEMEETPATVLDVIAGSADHSALAAAVKAAGLEETLKGDGPFTVFAPTNAAFEKLPEGTVEDLLKPENKEKLVDILTYHVVASKVMAEDAKGLDGKEAEAVNKKMLKVSVKDGSVMINDSTVETADLEAGNGVVHSIDTVLLPK